MSQKFEQLLDYLVNEEHDKANELFHEIVVEKSREIYENLIAEEEKEEEEMDEAQEDEDESVDEAADEEDEAMDESADEEADETVESISDEAVDEEFPIQDKTDDAEDDVAADMGDEEGDEGDEGDGDDPATKDDIQDLEDALEELKAEFEALMAAEKHEEEEEPGVHGEPSPLDDLGGDDETEKETMMPVAMETADEEEMDESAEDQEEEAMESRAKSQGEMMREYIEKVSATMTDGAPAGAGTGETIGTPTHGKSPISSGSGKPTSGANASNIATDTAKHSEDGTSPKGKVGGLVKTGGDFVKSGTKNVASSANSKKPDGAKLTSVSKPASGEGKPVGAGTGQNSVSGATNTKSIVDKKIG